MWNTAYEYEVESSMLTLEQTDHLSVLLLSQEVSIITDRQSLPIIITDITSKHHPNVASPIIIPRRSQLNIKN